MKLRTCLRAVGAAAVIVAATLALVAASSSAAKPKKVYWIDLAGTASQHPDRVFFTANAGGYVEDLDWQRWGKNRTVGRGTFGTTAPCNGSPCPDGPAKLTLRKPVRCTPEFGSKKGKTVRVYKHAKLRYPDGEGGRSVSSVNAGWAACEQFRR